VACEGRVVFFCAAVGWVRGGGAGGEAGLEFEGCRGVVGEGVVGSWVGDAGGLASWVGVSGWVGGWVCVWAG
jgi:hypothetical protein